MAKQYDVVIRILSVGDSGVGKTCMIRRFADDTFVDKHDKFGTTIGIDFKMKPIELSGKRIRLQLWDTAGQERYETLTKQYFRRAQGILLVYDITNEESYQNLEKWMRHIKDYADDECQVLLVANKCDMKHMRRVEVKQGRQLAKHWKIPFFETSAKEDSNVQQAFEELTKQVMAKHKKEFDRIHLDRMDSDGDEVYVSELEKGTSERHNCCSS